MPRIARSNLDTPFLHVMIQGINKEYIFEQEKYIEKYLDIISKNKDDESFTFIAYCIMNNHAHFLTHIQNMDNFQKFMHKCNLLYVKFYNKEKSRIGVLFRNRYQSEPIYNIKYLINCINYIHENPVKAGMVSKCEDYKYSSYNDYINNCGVTKTKIMNEIFGSDCSFLELFNNTFNRRFIDIGEEKSKFVNDYIQEGIREYKKINNICISEVLSDREVFRKVILFLNKNCNFENTEIRKFFEISKGAMDGLVRRNNIMLRNEHKNC